MSGWDRHIADLDAINERLEEQYHAQCALVLYTGAWQNEKLQTKTPRFQR
ncbi:hypothetical protein NG798_15310 [Ancylothrix sp. C2]|nr:hypothetical protein [Ancylothrix sp. D3o]MCT7951167.1 hypothetical protein [Ancylothrix sp. D3o]